MVTRKEVAEKAGVSVAVVSYVMNDRKLVKEVTRRKVLAAMEELGYQPNLAARSLKTKKSQQLAVLVNDLGNPFESGILLRIEKEARLHGYTVFFQPYLKDSEEQLKSQFMGMVDGILLLGQSLKETTMEHFRKMNIPILSITTPVSRSLQVPVIDLDWSREFVRIIRHLKEEGHRSIAFMSSGNIQHHYEHRFHAFRQAMKGEQCHFESDFLLNGEGRLEQTHRTMKEKLSQWLPALPFTAIVCANDLMAAGVLAACHDMGVEVPDRLAIVGCEDILMSSHTYPKLTALHYPREQLGIAAVGMLLKLMRGEPVDDLMLEASLLERGSTLRSNR